MSALKNRKEKSKIDKLTKDIIVGCAVGLIVGLAGGFTATIYFGIGMALGLYYTRECWFT